MPKQGRGARRLGLPLSRPALVAMLASARTQPVMLITRTTPAMRKRNNPLLGRGVVCYAGRNGFIGADYASVVNRQRDREQQPLDKEGNVEQFYAEQLWCGKGEHVAGNRHLVRHKGSGELYLVFFPRSDAEGNAQAQWKQYRFADTDMVVSAGLVEPYLLGSGGSSRQGTQKRIAWRTIALTSLVSIRMAGVTYELIDEQPQAQAA